MILSSSCFFVFLEAKKGVTPQRFGRGKRQFGSRKQSLFQDVWKICVPTFGVFSNGEMKVNVYYIYILDKLAVCVLFYG